MLISKWSLKLIGVLCLVLASPMGHSSGDKLTALNEHITTNAAGLNIAGVSVALVKDRQLVHLFAAGTEYSGTDRKMNSGTVMQVGSLSKPVAAWVVMSLVERGLLELDAPASKYLTRWQLPDSEFDRREVTIRRLLSHTAGLSLGGYPGFAPEVQRPAIEASLSGATNGAGDVQLTMLPGSGWSYSGGGYTLLQLIVEEVTGLTFADYARQYVLGPLDMRNSSYAPDDRLLEWSAQAHDSRGQPLPNYRFTAEAAAGLHSTAEDLAKFVVANMSENSVLLPQSVALMHTAVAHSDVRYGFGFAIKQDGDVVFHSGSNIGWKAYMSFTPATGDGIVILTNADNGSRIVDGVLCHLHQNFDMAQYAEVCDSEADAKTLGLQVISVLAVVLALLMLFTGLRLRQPDITMRLPAVMSVRGVCLLVLAVALIGWLLFWHTTLGVQTFYGFPHTRAIDFVPTALIPGSYLIQAMIGVLAVLTLQSRNRS